ncbi:MAG: hypothetical protein WAW96_09190 [Alphaproteobacteria bacterium]
MRFRNPANDYEESTNAAWLWCLLFGPLYWLVKGIWSHALLQLVLSCFILPWLVYPFFAGAIVRSHYLRKGWIEVDPAKSEPFKAVGIALAAVVVIVAIGHFAGSSIKSSAPAITTAETAKATPVATTSVSAQEAPPDPVSPW